ncbi:MAG: acyltransferase [Methanomassiliicoccales archaeon]|jgi:acetyltransferase-like isoleucine patch superfamily enzyme
MTPIHPDAKVLGEHVSIVDCEIGEGTVVRDFVNLYGCRIGRDCKIACFVEIQRGVTLGDRCKVEAFAFIPSGVTIEDEVFVGPHATFTNDLHPRATGDWKITPTLVKRGSSIGAGAVVVCGVSVGERAMIGAGAVVTKDVPPHTLVIGNPARAVKVLR